MKKLLLKKVVIAIVMFSVLFSSMPINQVSAANGDGTAADIFGMSVYINVDSSGTYTLGEDFEFSIKAYVGDKLWHKVTTTRTLAISGPSEVSDFIFYDINTSEWKGISDFNITAVSTNVTGRDVKVKFNQEGTYVISYVYTGEDGSIYGQAEPIYLTIADGTFTATKTAPENTMIYSDDVAVEGYQISTTLEGSRVVGSVEPSIYKKTVSKWGLIYGLSQVNNDTFNVKDEDLYVGTDNEKVLVMESTEAGTLSQQLGDSSTATYFVRTTLFGSKTNLEFDAKYKVRAYAQLSDGTYVYSKVKEYTVYQVADDLYKNCKMTTQETHDYLYNSILKVVNDEYSIVEYSNLNTVLNSDEL